MPNISALSPELQRRIVSHLSRKDAVSYSQASTNQNKALNLSAITQPIVSSIRWYGGYHNGDTPRKFLEIPLLLRSRIHSIVLRCEWKDQGWGDQKGQLFIKKGNDENVIDLSGLLAPHLLDDFEVSFHVDASSSYQIWYKVGGGGHHHELLIRNLEIQYIFFDEPGLYLSKNFEALAKHNALQTNTFWFRFLLSCCQSMINQAQNLKCSIDPFLSDFLISAGIAVNVSSLESLIELCFSLENEKLPEEMTGLGDASGDFDDDEDTDSISTYDGILWGY
mmetsp:Transcript_17464/g.25227  ORF Transcript_17464/g.25227 Transcript_17464/m.25227 type:complete len:279 (+) Transcript_17464:111-947(+)|eukprot:CAMPEP_0202442398 /NCGR_PEP_ID=MMETSP1360-20130828/1850_1 /ASSEMBLY_ACC=CAM_ASM_000848 /TAXON_ID=515479 /ORGANISM="Licmophora paradoxa, Strain CCMP2313" /LENGTH=278 /DNA_ID=CAMNT_0049057755 /DNA_START=111 /DNA_END=947 /DNA_ORIENTATION=+